MISVIIPTHNREEFLKEAIQSVLDQDGFDFGGRNSDCELLVVDDGSTDDTRGVVESFEAPVVYHYQDHQGVSAARNFGLRKTRGEFVAFLDSDDLWKKNKLGVQMSLMKSMPQIMVCYTEEVWIRRGTVVNPRKKHQKYSGWIFDKVLSICLLSLSSALFRRTVFEEVGGFDEDLPACEDYDLGLRVAHRYPIHLISTPLIIKRGGHADQLSHKFWGMDRFRVKALEKALLLDLTPQQQEQVRRELIKKCRILVSGFEKRNRKSEAEHYSRLLQKYQIEQEGV